MHSFTRRDVITIVLAVVVAAGCAGLGFWQLDRLAQRQAHNREVETAMSAAPAPLDSLDIAPSRLMRVRLKGAPDYRHEIAITGRTRNGSPGVNIVTPFRIAGRDTAVLVNRGWVYSPDASQVDFARWKEVDSMTVMGYVDTLSTRKATVGAPVRQVRQLEHQRIAAQLPYPVATYFVVALAEGTTRGPDTPVRLPLPALDEGSHKSYAIQWFSFGAIALLGTAAYLRASRTRSA